MKWLQNGNLAKLVAFFVIAVVITCTVSFAANGWQSFITTNPESDNIAVNNTTQSDNVDENKDGDSTNQDIPVTAPVPTYYHYLTGLETDLEGSLKKPLCVVLSSQDPLYGISSSYMTVEMPVEYGNTRILCFTDSAQYLGKIGSIAPSRGYISNIATYLGGVLLSYGYDDMFDYEYYTPESSLDFSAISGYCYTEYNTMNYTNGDLVSAFINNAKINTVTTGSPSRPYDFCEVENSIIKTDKSASNIIISFSDDNHTELTFSDTENKYLFSKNSGSKTDLLNDKVISYDNAFVLFADSTTYETSDSTQLILNTLEGGKGYYISNGAFCDITWSRDTSGNLVFFSHDGSKLIINRGTSYIAFVKSSVESTVKVS